VSLTQSGSGINGSTSYLIGGNDLRLHCNISANPSYNKLVWLHNSNQLYYDLKKGITYLITRSMRLVIPDSKFIEFLKLTVQSEIK